MRLGLEGALFGGDRFQDELNRLTVASSRLLEGMVAPEMASSHMY